MPSRILKEQIIEKTIKSDLHKMAEHKVKHLEPHFIYAGRCSLYSNIPENAEIPLRSSLLKLMTKYQIKTVMLTIIYMTKEKLITQEQMKSYCRGEQSSRQISVNEDLEAFFEDLQLGKHKSNDDVLAYYLPRLTEDEMALVEAKDQNYFQNFSISHLKHSKNPDVPEYVMKMSESESKFALGKCNRKSIKINLDRPYG